MGNKCLQSLAFILTMSLFIVTSVGITYQFTTLKLGVDVFASECGRVSLLELLTNNYHTYVFRPMDHFLLRI